MKFGFVKVAAATPKIKLADTAANAVSIIREIDVAASADVKVLVFPELCITGYTCGDLFYQEVLLNGAVEALKRIAEHTALKCEHKHSQANCGADTQTANGCGAEKHANVGADTQTANGGVSDMLIFVGLPLRLDGKIYNVAAAVKGGEVLGFIPKKYLPNYNEFYDKRQFAPADFLSGSIKDYVCGVAKNSADGSAKDYANKNSVCDSAKNSLDGVAKDYACGVVKNSVEGLAKNSADGMAKDYACGVAKDPVFGAPVSDKLIFACASLPELKIAAEICEDLWVMSPPSVAHAAAGATVIVNPSASNELIGKAEYRRSLVAGQSARLLCGYVYASAGDGESVTDIVFSGHNIIAENGTVLNEAELFKNRLVISEIDVKRLVCERSKLAGYAADTTGYTVVPFDFELKDASLTRKFPKNPFVPADGDALNDRAELILTIQAHALKSKLGQRFKAVIGVSGGLDSTLALLVAVRSFGLLNRPLDGIVPLTIPCFGTTDRTLKNARALAKALGLKLGTVKINASVKSHLADISDYYDSSRTDVVYENAQARGRTYVLMDVANAAGGIVVGTGDLSEAALGWCTYNGDHMSMYGINSSVPKTLVKYLVRYEAKRLGGTAERVLNDILDTPISPELIPPENGEITQKTEDIIGPYELHDFFLYYLVRYGFSPDKILRIAAEAFKDDYKKETVAAWLDVFIKRFFANQFKRNCVPDGVKIGSVSLSPRGDWRMPSDAFPSNWLKKTE
ncbi:MAG: NAD(+) synthase [Clostridiaceae bacterium]|jgi:NAD+ synthase (glutamine-hydrolysing)|nr:NAD(+) synthase [Clostridiaceae bacterium]